jgi:hypothetical protein
MHWHFSDTIPFGGHAGTVLQARPEREHRAGVLNLLPWRYAGRRSLERSLWRQL